MPYPGRSSAGRRRHSTGTATATVTREVSLGGKIERTAASAATSSSAPPPGPLAAPPGEPGVSLRRSVRRRRPCGCPRWGDGARRRAGRRDGHGRRRHERDALLGHEVCRALLVRRRHRGRARTLLEQLDDRVAAEWYQCRPDRLRGVEDHERSVWLQRRLNLWRVKDRSRGCVRGRVGGRRGRRGRAWRRCVGRDRHGDRRGRRRSVGRDRHGD